MENIANVDSESSSPIVAVRNITNNLLAQRDNQPILYDRSSNRCHGSRLKNIVGLNITDDEYVALKLKQLEENKRRHHKLHESQTSTMASSGNARRTKNTASNKVTNSTMNKENKLASDSNIGDAIQLLDDPIDFTENIFERQLSMEL